jgi:uncharacterized protein (DUF433 family)
MVGGWCSRGRKRCCLRNRQMTTKKSGSRTNRAGRRSPPPAGARWPTTRSGCDTTLPIGGRSEADAEWQAAIFLLGAMATGATDEADVAIVVPLTGLGRAQGDGHPIDRLTVIGLACEHVHVLRRLGALTTDGPWPGQVTPGGITSAASSPGPYDGRWKKRCDVFDRITVEIRRMGGQPCIRGQRFTVAHLMRLVAEGWTLEQIQEDFPFIEAEDVHQALSYAAEATVSESFPLREPA